MILGVEGVHTWETGLVINDRSEYPMYRLRRISGLHATPDFDPISDNATGRIGEISRFQSRRGKTINYEGEVVAQSLAGLRTATGDLIAAFAGTDELQMDVEPHPDYAGSDLLARRFSARPLDVGVEDDQTSIAPFKTSRGYERPFSVSLRMSDPRFYYPDITVETQDTRETLDGTGDIIVPSGETDPPDDQGLEVTITNEGNYNTEARFIIEGRVWNPVISNETTGKFLAFTNQDLEAADDITIDTRRRRAMRGSDNKNIRYKIVPESTWWDRGEVALVPGANVIRLRGYIVGASATLTVRARSADIA